MAGIGTKMLISIISIVVPGKKRFPIEKIRKKRNKERKKEKRQSPSILNSTHIYPYQMHS